MVTSAKKATTQPADTKKSGSTTPVKAAGKTVAQTVVQPVIKPAVKTETKSVAKPALKSSAVKPAVKSAGAPKTKLKASTAPKPVLSTEQRNHYVSVAAFYIAERRGFTLGDPAQDWLAAEAEVDRLIASGHFTI